jgi:glutamine synthetase
MSNNPLPKTQLASYERGFGDYTMKADLNSLKEINYINDHRQVILFSDLYESNSDELVTHAPRYLLRKAVEDLKALGYTAQFQCDINFNVLNDKYKKLSENFSLIQPITEHSNQYHALYKQNFEEFLSKLKSTLKFSGIIVDKIAGDIAPGQYKVSLSLSNPLEFCDELTIFKLVNNIIIEFLLVHQEVSR